MAPFYFTHIDGSASSRGPLPSTDHGAVSTAAAHENPRGPCTVVSRPAPESLLWTNPSPGTEEPEENRRSRLPSGGARAWSTSLDARNIGEGGDSSPRGMAHSMRSSRNRQKSLLLGCRGGGISKKTLGNTTMHISTAAGGAVLSSMPSKGYTSVRRPPSTILRMRGARPPPGLPPGGEAATGAPPALASPGISREAATVRTHAYPNRQIDRQGRAGGRARGRTR